MRAFLASASTTLIATSKIGIAVGTLAWGSGNATWYRNFGATITGNIFQSSGGAFAYGMCVRSIPSSAGVDSCASGVGGMNDTTISGNMFTKGKYAAAESENCVQEITYPYPQAMVVDPYTTTGSYSGTTTLGDVAFLIWSVGSSDLSALADPPTA